MKLNVDFSNLITQVNKMGAEDIDFDIVISAAPLDPIYEALSKGGIEVNLADITAKSGLLEHKGHQILLFIPEQWDIRSTLFDGSKGNRYHVAECTTLQEMRNKGRFERYVATNNVSGSFAVFGEDKKTQESIEGEAELKVCKNCLKHLNYKGYMIGNKGQIFNKFDLTNFFETFSSYFKQLPRSIVKNSSKGYSDDWPIISGKYKAEQSFCCEQCSVVLKENKNLLHVHHVNGVKSDNKLTNLRSLCADCHKKQPDHNHLNVTHVDIQTINSLRNNQGIVNNSSWSEVRKLADTGMEGLVLLCEQNQLPLPEVGGEVANSKDEVIAQFELGWLRNKVAVVIEPEDAKKLTDAGWLVWDMVHAINEFARFAGQVR